MIQVSFKMLFVLIVVLFANKLVKCQVNHLYDSIIVNAINNYRNNFVCTQAIRNAELISSKQELVNIADMLIRNETKWSLNEYYIQITPKTCDYVPDITKSFENNVLRFIRRCISKTKLPGSSVVPWVWNSIYNSIGCAYSPMDEVFILCILNKYENLSNVTSRPKIDSSKTDRDLLKQNGALFTNMCPRIELQYYKSCYLLTSTRDYITNEVNSYRKKLFDENGYTFERVKVKWDSALEMSAVELSKFMPVSSTDNCFSISSHPKGYTIHGFLPNKYFLVEPNLSTEIIQFIADSDFMSRNLYAIGCTYFLFNHKGMLLCIWNKDGTIKSTLSFWVHDVKNYLAIKPYLVYIAIGIVLMNILVIVLFIKAARNYNKQNHRRRRPIIESIYSKPQ